MDNIIEYIHKQGYTVAELDPFVRQKAPSFSKLPYDEKFKIVKEVISERQNFRENLAMKKIITESDMGNIKIYNDTLSCFFDNQVGDVENVVYVAEKEEVPNEYKWGKPQFLGHFTVKKKAYLSAYDCSDESVYAFGKGRWFVTLIEPAVFIITKVDEDIRA